MWAHIIKMLLFAMAVLFIHLDYFCISTPLQPIKPGSPINSFIRHYEPVKYDRVELKRHRRSTALNDKHGSPLKFNIKTRYRSFNLVLTPDRNLFAKDAIFETGSGEKVNFDPEKAYTGVIEDEEDSIVHGIITDDGLFDGTIVTPSEEYYIEPISRYLSEGQSPISSSYHTIVYRNSDVDKPYIPFCASEALHKNKKIDKSTSSNKNKTLWNGQVIDSIMSVNADKLSDNRLNFSHFSYQLNDERPRARIQFSEDLNEDLSSSRSNTESNLVKDLPSVENPHSFTYQSNKYSKFKDPHFNSPNSSSLNSSRFSNFKIKNVDSEPVYNSDLSDLYELKDENNPNSEAPIVRHKRWYIVMNETSKNNSVSSSTDDQVYSVDNPETDKAKTSRPFVNYSDQNSNNKHSKSLLYDAGIYNTNLYSITNGIIRMRPTNNGVINNNRGKNVLVNEFSGDRSNILIGTGFDGDFFDDYDLRQHVRKRATIDPRKTTCMLYLQADHLFFEKYGTEEACIEVMTRHVQRVNSIYKYTDFNMDGQADNISFMIKRIKVHSGDALNDPAYRFPGNYGVEKFLEIFSEEDYDAFCLAYMFTYRDFEMGTLGLAWTGDLKNAGGVCEKNGHYRGSMKSLNTGIVTLLNYGKHVPPAVSHVTLAHEIGHNFGSPHDPEICTPGGDDGNFIMFARATSGDKKNNNRFSPCSLNSINPVLNTKARSAKGCFTEPQVSICGNGVVEGEEECDCGWEEDCSDKCCFPQRRYPPVDEPPCHLTPHSMCSPSQGPCCTADCSLKFGDKCRDDNGCRDSSFCDGRGPSCPPSINKPNKTICNEEFVCFMGECTGSICLAYGLESCQCIPGPNDSPTKACELCCKFPGENQPCLSSYKWNSVPFDVPDMLSKPGTPCNDYNGYCDVFQRCREVDPSGPLATLRKLLLSEESIASFKKWAIDHWYYSTLIILSFILILILSTRLFGKRPALKLKGVTIIHSSTTETVRLPPDANAPGVTVHPAIKSKLPLKCKVRGDRRKIVASKPKKDISASSAAKKKNSLSEKNKKNESQVIKPDAFKQSEESTPENSPTRKVQNKSKSISKDKKRHLKTKKLKDKDDRKAEKKLESFVSIKTPEEDPLGKVRNWLMNSHIDGFVSVRKSKSSPAGFTPKETQQVQVSNTQISPSDNKPAKSKTASNKTGAKTDNEISNSDQKVKLQVVYKPAFKFYVKLQKPNVEVQTRAIKSKQKPSINPEKQRALILLKAEKNAEQKIRQKKKKMRKLADHGKRPISEKKENISSDKTESFKVQEVVDSNANTNALSEADKIQYLLCTENIPTGKNSDQVKLIDNKEPFYANSTPIINSPEYENLKAAKSIDLLRLSSTECQVPLSEAMLPQKETLDSSRFQEDCDASGADQVSALKKSVTPNRSSDILDRHSSVRNKKLFVDTGQKRHSIDNVHSVNLMRFPSVENTEDSRTSFNLSDKHISPLRSYELPNLDLSQSQGPDKTLGSSSCKSIGSSSTPSSSISSRSSPKVGDASSLSHSKSFRNANSTNECDKSNHSHSQ